VENSPCAQAVVVNAGIANACTGEEGLRYCMETAEAAADSLSIPVSSVLVASTGVIGKQLPMDRIVAGVKAMVPALDGSQESGRLGA